jgi:hypothetical protein
MEYIVYSVTLPFLVRGRKSEGPSEGGRLEQTRGLDVRLWRRTGEGRTEARGQKRCSVFASVRRSGPRR